MPSSSPSNLPSQNSPVGDLDPTQLALPVWRTAGGEPVSCLEKVKVLNENLAELQAMAQDALEDAVLMGCDEAQFRMVMRALVESLVNPYRDQP
jgi:hypothetical protein